MFISYLLNFMARSFSSHCTFILLHVKFKEIDFVLTFLYSPSNNIIVECYFKILFIQVIINSSISTLQQSPLSVIAIVCYSNLAKTFLYATVWTSSKAKCLGVEFQLKLLFRFRDPKEYFWIKFPFSPPICQSK